MGPSLKKWLVQYLRLDQIGPMTHLGPGPFSDIEPGPMWHMGLAYYWQVRLLVRLVSSPFAMPPLELLLMLPLGRREGQLHSKQKTFKDFFEKYL